MSCRRRLRQICNQKFQYSLLWVFELKSRRIWSLLLALSLWSLRSFRLVTVVQCLTIISYRMGITSQSRTHIKWKQEERKKCKRWLLLLALLWRIWGAIKCLLSLFLLQWEEEAFSLAVCCVRGCGTQTNVFKWRNLSAERSPWVVTKPFLPKVTQAQQRIPWD